MDIIKHESMIVKCEHCSTICSSNDISDFRDCGHTYPPSIYFICPECKKESKVLNFPNRLKEKLVTNIMVERGYNTSINFNNGKKI
jgi:endogenous inhibitor of DNA gyrase (YacG/DUF329 family)